MADEIGIVGPQEFALGFRLAGIRKVITTTSEQEFQDAIDDVLNKREMADVGILIVDSADVENLPSATHRKLNETLEPVVVQMGAGAGGDLREKVKSAIGIDVYKE